MNYVIDIILICIILLIVFISSKKGIVVTVADIASGILAFVAAKLIAPAAADWLYLNVAKQPVTDFLTEKYAGIENGISDALSNVTSIFDFLPDGIMSYINSAGYLDSDALASGIMSNITTVSQLESQLVAPIVTAILNILCFGVLSIVLLIVFRIVGRLVAKLITSAKIAEKLDSILGAVFGLVKGLIYVFIIAAVISVVSFSSETLAAYAADSYICSFVAGIIGF